LHIEYVQAARKYAAAIRRRNRVITAVVGVILVALTIFALIQRGEALINLDTANTQQAIAQAKATEANQQRATAQANEVLAQQNYRAANSLASRSSKKAMIHS
jgi:lactam utilization protein B